MVTDLPRRLACAAVDVEADPVPARVLGGVEQGVGAATGSVRRGVVPRRVRRCVGPLSAGPEAWGGGRVRPDITVGEEQPQPVVAEVALAVADSSAGLDGEVDRFDRPVARLAGGEVGQPLGPPGPQGTAEPADLGDWAGQGGGLDGGGAALAVGGANTSESSAGEVSEQVLTCALEPPGERAVPAEWRAASRALLKLIRSGVCLVAVGFLLLGAYRPVLVLPPVGSRRRWRPGPSGGRAGRARPPGTAELR